MTLTSRISYGLNSNFHFISISQSTTETEKTHFSVSPIQSLVSKFDFRPRSTKVTMYIKFSYYLESHMLHIKFQGNQPSGSGEDF